MRIELQSTNIGKLTIAVAIASLLILAVGSIVSILAWPLLMAAYNRANRALGFVALTVNVVSGLIALLVCRLAARRSTVNEAGLFLRRNTGILKAASTVILILLIEQILAFFANEIRTQIVVHGPRVEWMEWMTPGAAGFIAATGIISPLLIIGVLLVANARSKAEE